jgi:class 3 adenylate cyclase
MRFNLPGDSIDYSGKSVNYASRLCSVASKNEMITEAELYDYLEDKRTKAPCNYLKSKVDREMKKWVK